MNFTSDIAKLQGPLVESAVSVLETAATLGISWGLSSALSGFGSSIGSRFIYGSIGGALPAIGNSLSRLWSAKDAGAKREAGLELAFNALDLGIGLGVGTFLSSNLKVGFILIGGSAFMLESAREMIVQGKPFQEALLGAAGSSILSLAIGGGIHALTHHNLYNRLTIKPYARNLVSLPGAQAIYDELTQLQSSGKLSTISGWKKNFIRPGETIQEVDTLRVAILCDELLHRIGLSPHHEDLRNGLIKTFFKAGEAWLFSQGKPYVNPLSGRSFTGQLDTTAVDIDQLVYLYTRKKTSSLREAVATPGATAEIHLSFEPNPRHLTTENLLRVRVQYQFNEPTMTERRQALMRSLNDTGAVGISGFSASSPLDLTPDQRATLFKSRLEFLFHRHPDTHAIIPYVDVAFLFDGAEGTGMRLMRRLTGYFKSVDATYVLASGMAGQGKYYWPKVGVKPLSPQEYNKFGLQHLLSETDAVEPEAVYIFYRRVLFYALLGESHDFGLSHTERVRMAVKLLCERPTYVEIARDKTLGPILRIVLSDEKKSLFKDSFDFSKNPFMAMAQDSTQPLEERLFNLVLANCWNSPFTHSTDPLRVGILYFEDLLRSRQALKPK